MIVFVALWILTFDCCPTSIFLANKTSIFESFMINIFYTSHTDSPIFLLKITLRHPDSTYIVYPNIMTSRNISRISWFNKIIVVIIFFFVILNFFRFFLNYFFFRFILSLNFKIFLIFLILFDHLFITFLFLFIWRVVFLFLFTIRTSLCILVISWIYFFENICINMNRCSFHSSSLYITQRTR